MMVRNLEELGPTLQKIVTRLQANQDLLKLLYYTDKDPLSQPDLTEEQIRKEVFNQLVAIVPKLPQREDAKSAIAICVTNGTENGNDEFVNIQFTIDVVVPLTQWIIKDANLRPFSILGQIKKSLKGKTMNNIGKITGGDFHLNYISDEMSSYGMDFSVINYD